MLNKDTALGGTLAFFSKRDHWRKYYMYCVSQSLINWSFIWGFVWLKLHTVFACLMGAL